MQILTKCLAKLCGGYGKLSSLTVRECYKMLTGLGLIKVRKNFVTSINHFKEHILSQMGRGFVPVFKKGKDLGIIKRIHNNNIVIITPLKGENTIPIVSHLKDSQADILMLRS